MTRKTLLPPGGARPPFSASPAIQAGDWVFLGGTMATDWKTGVIPEYRGNGDFPYDAHAMSLQTEGIYQQVKGILSQVGSEPNNMVRIDQFTPHHSQFRHYLPVRDQYLTKDRPASTAVAIKDLLVPGVVMQIDGIAIIARPGFEKTGYNAPKAPRPRAGYSLAIRAGDWIWCAGASPTDFKSRAPYPGAPGHGIPDDVQVDPNFWYGSEIRNQAAYDLHKLELYLDDAGSDLKHIVKAQVYLTDPRDLPGLMEVWQEVFGDDPPATTVVPIDQMGIAGSRCEINVIAIAKGSSLGREVIKTNKAPKPHFPAPQAIKAGPYLFLSHQYAVNDDGIDARVKPSAVSPFLCSAGRDEMAVILDHAAAICEAAGGSLSDLVRVQVFSPDLREFGPALGPWEQAFAGGDAPCLTVVGHTQPHIIPSLSLAADLTAYLG